MDPTLTEEDFEALRHLAPPMNAREVAEATIELGLADDMPAEFTPREGEPPLGTRVATADGDGTVIEYVAPRLTRVQAQEIEDRGESVTDLPRQVIVAMDDGSLRAVNHVGP